MGLLGTHARGFLKKVLVKTETSPGTYIKPVAADGIEVLSFKVTPNKERKPSEENRTVRAAMERIDGKASVSWSLECYVKPSGTAGTPPDIHPLLKAAFPGYTNTPNTSDYYIPNSATSLGTVTLECNVENQFQETVWGAWVDKVTIEASGASPPKISFEGGGMGYALTAATTLSAGMVTTANMPLTDYYAVAVNSRVKIGSDDNSGAGYKVTSVNYATGTHVIESSISATIGATVTPFVPTPTYGGAAATGLTGYVQVAGSNVPITAFKMEYTNGIKPMSDEAFTEYPADFLPMTRECKLTVSFRLRSDLHTILTPRVYDIEKTVDVELGNVAGARLDILFTGARYEYSEIEASGADEAVISIPFVVMGASDDTDVALTWY